MNQSGNSPGKSCGHFGSGDPGYYETWLTGDREGLTKLRDHIDQLLETGVETPFADSGLRSDFDGLAIERDKYGEVGEYQSPWYSPFIYLIGILILISLIALPLLGIWKLIEVFSS